MNTSIQQAVVSDAHKSAQILESKLNELKNVNRIATNALNLINDMDIKGAYSEPVSEVKGWLNGIISSVKTQTEVIESSLPKKEEKVELEAK